MPDPDGRRPLRGGVTVFRGPDGFKAALDAVTADGLAICAEQMVERAALLAWVNECSVADAMRIELSDCARFAVGPQPVRGHRSPTLGDLLLSVLLKPVESKSLYPFQHVGVDWLCRTPRAVLADDMGLGKTLQVMIALERILSGRLGAQALIVAPKTLVPNWLKESVVWIPRLVVRSAEQIGAGSYRGGAHIVVSTYEEMIQNHRLRENTWLVVVADEAHRLRTGDSARSKWFRDLRSEFLWLLTGTPIENSPADLAVLLSYLDPVRFSARMLLSDPETVRPTAEPYFLRRRKTDVLSELPLVKRVDIELELSPDQSRRYFDVLLGRDGISRIHLQKIAQCRAICDLDEQTESSAKLDWLEEFYEHHLPADEKVVVFSAYLPVLRAAARRLRSRWSESCQYLSGETAAEERQAIVESFQQESGPRILLLSMGVGAEGITLTRANHVVFLNEWWNPSTNHQARDRVLRIGQHRQVHEYRLITRGTVEQRVRDLVVSKQATIDEIVEALARGTSRHDLLMM